MIWKWLSCWILKIQFVLIINRNVIKVYIISLAQTRTSSADTLLVKKRPSVSSSASTTIQTPSATSKSSQFMRTSTGNTRAIPRQLVVNEQKAADLVLHVYIFIHAFFFRWLICFIHPPLNDLLSNNFCFNFYYHW